MGLFENIFSVVVNSCFKMALFGAQKTSRLHRIVRFHILFCGEESRELNPVVK